MDSEQFRHRPQRPKSGGDTLETGFDKRQKELRMTKNKTSAQSVDALIAATETGNQAQRVEETPFEFVASICSILVVGMFVLTFLGQNFVIPSGSMESTLLVGDHLLVDRITTAPHTSWMPLVHQREPKRGDITVFIKPVPDLDAENNPNYLVLVKRLIGVPGDHIHLHSGIVYINGVAQTPPPDSIAAGGNSEDKTFLDEFPKISPAENPYATPTWQVEFPNNFKDGDLVVPQGMYFMMGDHRHNSLDSRYWGFVPRENIMGRPLFNYWSFQTPDGQYDQNQSGIVSKISWMGHIATHLFSDTRWNRTLKVVR